LIARLEYRDLWQRFGVRDDRPPVVASDRDGGGIGRGYNHPDSRATIDRLKRQVRERITAPVADFLVGAEETFQYKAFEFRIGHLAQC
jgi:hypothetical protein